ncbi:regulator of nonsense transcripts 1 homolog, partial [Contarinia nasturtii]|uniref:regulator of nonsense transcripts 1 homolog n=1 Tax=Contarinia nasturtii TaxID=265458 RepID=UPI0012D4B017
TLENIMQDMTLCENSQSDNKHDSKIEKLPSIFLVSHSNENTSKDPSNELSENHDNQSISMTSSNIVGLTSQKNDETSKCSPTKDIVQIFSNEKEKSLVEIKSTIKSSGTTAMDYTASNEIKISEGLPDEIMSPAWSPVETTSTKLNSKTEKQHPAKRKQTRLDGISLGISTRPAKLAAKCAISSSMETLQPTNLQSTNEALRPINWRIPKLNHNTTPKIDQITTTLATNDLSVPFGKYDYDVPKEIELNVEKDVRSTESTYFSGFTNLIHLEEIAHIEELEYFNLKTVTLRVDGLYEDTLFVDFTSTFVDRYEFRVLICTLATTDFLATSRNQDRDFNPKHFSHLFIDEAACMQEPLSFIPIAGLCSTYQNIHCKIILSGDPKQLDTVIKAQIASNMGLKRSWMENLLQKPIYQHHNGEFNYNCIVQLTKNYRSHPHILHLANDLYYDNKLEPFAGKENCNMFIGTEILPNQDFPVIFHNVQGICKYINNSAFNLKEIDLVMYYIDKLADGVWNGEQIQQEDIGVISPYKQQFNAIKAQCESKGYSRILIGSAESFQGQEKSVIIISIARTSGKFEFVADPKRVNVMVTRAKCFLIIIGDLTYLDNDKDWNKILNYCKDNQCLIGMKHPRILPPY